MDDYVWRKDSDRVGDSPDRWISRHNDRRLVVDDNIRDKIDKKELNPDVLYLDLNPTYIEIEKLADNASLVLAITGPTINYRNLTIVTYIPHTKQITGSVVLRLTDAISLEDLYVLPQFRRRKYGSTLLQIANRTFNCHLLECNMEDADAHAFYAANHWRIIGTTIRNTHLMYHV